MMSYDRSDAIVRSILSLGRALNIDITAEGVETLPRSIFTAHPLSCDLPSSISYG
jgi:EAL domain-containing protein (putative c-di-GMP-specific phosphodiesterase class I)